METSTDEGQAFLLRIASVESLKDAWKHLNKANPASYGLSGETIAVFAKDLDAKIESISSDLLGSKYKFQKNRASLIPKDNGDLRPLQIPEIRDRLVLKSLALAIEKELENKLKASKAVSFAYQKGVGIKHVTEKIREHAENGYTWVLEADIVKFFDKVDRDRLLSEHVYSSIPNSSAARNLIEKGLTQKLDISNIPAKDQHYFEGLGSGIPQGNPLSPLLSNIYLHKFDLYMIDQSYKLVRYADDFIVMLKSTDEAEKCLKQVVKFLKDELGLELHPLGVKTRIIDLKKQPFTFLSITYDGKVFFPSDKSVQLFKEKIDSLCFGVKAENSILQIMTSIRNTLDGWISSYSFTDVDRHLETVDAYINKQFYLYLRGKDWKFTTTVRGQLKKKFIKKGSSGDCLSDKQRVNSGIPFAKTILKERRSDRTE